jgi:glutaminyl-peptide cyclotransferase
MLNFGLLSCMLAMPACDRGGKVPAGEAAAAPVRATAWTNFSGDRAMADVREIVALGPRPSGSAALEASRKFIETRLREAGWETQRQNFDAKTNLRGTLRMANIRARFPVAGTETWTRGVSAVVGSHYDTKWFQSTRFVGANDGGSSTGLLLEVARAAAPVKEFAARLELVFFDGEEAVTGFTAPAGFNDTRFDGLFGSRYYAAQLRTLPRDRIPRYGIIFDMIGDEKLEVEFAANCSRRLSGLAREAASELGFANHFRETSEHITDDHVPLSWLGMEVLDFIDFNSYRGIWHTSADTLDKLNPQSIEIAGRTGLLFLEKYLAE